jgi:hypothetical protein
MNQFVTTETNKTATIVVTLLEHLLGHGHSVDGQFLFTRVGSVHEIQKTDCVGTSRADRKNVPPVVENRKVKKEHCGQHPGDVAGLAWQDKNQVTVIFIYHKDEMHVAINKVNQLQCKHVRHGSEGSNSTAILAGTKGRY